MDAPLAMPIVGREALGYLAGLSLDPTQLPAEGGWRTVPAAERRVLTIAGVGVNEPDGPTVGRLPTEAVVSGLAGERVPFAFEVLGRGDAVEIRVGTWGPPAVLERQAAVLRSLVDGAYPSVDVADGPYDGELDRFVASAIVLGEPGGVLGEREAPWDRLLRGLRGARFAVTVLAEPVTTDHLAALRDVALEDLRLAGAAQQSRSDLPLTRAYAGKLERLVDGLDRAIAVGGWRTAVYLLGDESSFWRLAAGWRGVFVDDAAVIPMRVVAAGAATRLAAEWSLPDHSAPAGPRPWRHPYLNQTLLDSRQLAAIAHFPCVDTPGFTVRPAPQFAVSRRPPSSPDRSVRIGEILSQNRRIGAAYRLDLDELTRHAFVAGLTGSGKTNTLVHLLTELDRSGVPFLVIEPAKCEYRELLGRPGIGDRLRVFTLGREQVAPLRLNPFEVPDGIDVSTHLDLLKAVFMGSFAMWIPLPQVLEQCLVELYTERGWDFTTGDHPHGRSTASVPTLGELVAAVERTVPRLGYKAESTQEITASLVTRLNSLRLGTRGLMLDVEESIAIEELLGSPTVVELEGLGDDADKAFVMGLLLVRLYEHRRAEAARGLREAAAAGEPAPPAGRLTHVVVVEEAHRLVAQSHKQTDSWNADPQGAFAEAFSQMLSEVRAYGQGIVIADQVPVRLAPDVVKNTNLKIVHRLVAGDDRTAMAAAMSMGVEQSKLLATLPRGRAAVFSEGDHAPVLVDVEKAKNLERATAIDDAAVAAAMSVRRVDRAPRRRAACGGVCESTLACANARRLAEDPVGRPLAMRLFNTAIVHPDGLDAVWPDVVSFVAARSPQRGDVARRAHAFAVHGLRAVVARRAIQAGWSRADVDELSAAVLAAIAERAGDPRPWLGPTPLRAAVIACADRLMVRTHDPFPLCASICPDGSCRYRDPIADLLTHERHARFDADLSTQPDPAAYIAQVGGFAANDVTAVSDAAPAGREDLVEAQWRAASCAALVKFCTADHPHASAGTVAAALVAGGCPIRSLETHIPEQEQ